MDNVCSESTFHWSMGLIVGRGLTFSHKIGIWQKQETVWWKQWRCSKKLRRGLVAREGSVTRKGREGPAARAAKTHRRRRRRGLEKVARKADPLHRLHPLKGQKFKSEGVGDKVGQKYICWVDRTGIRLKIGLE